MKRPRPRIRLLPPLLGALALGAGCSRGPAEAPNVVLVSMDTVRADHLSCYGYERATTPALDALAQRADRYAVCRATAPWTLPSHASMLTGLYPFQHGAQARRVDQHVAELPLAKVNDTLAEALQEHGYRTGGFVANRGYLGPEWGFGQGFDHYEPFKGERGNAGNLTRVALDWVDAGSRGRPFFLFLNYMDAHRPYNVDPLPEPRPGLPPPDPEGPQKLLNELVHAILQQDEPPDPELVARVITQYDQGIANLDLGIGALIAGLEQRGLWDRTVLVVTADHGEFLGEHDLVEHSKDVYEEVLAVPLIVRRPGQTAGRVVEERVSIAAIPSLVAGELPGELGADLRARFPSPSPDLCFAELRYTRAKDLNQPYGVRFARERTVVYAGRYKAIATSRPGEDELYDLAADPLEQHNLVLERPDVAERLLRLAREERARGEAAGPTGEPPELTPEMQQALHELGYTDAE